MLCRPHFGVVAEPCDLRFNLLERYAPIFPAERGASGDCEPKAAVGVEARNGSHSGISRQQAGAVKRLRALSAKREGSEGCAPRMPRIQRRNFCASSYLQSPRVAHSIVFMPSCMVFICSAISLLRSSASWRPSFFRACHAFFFCGSILFMSILPMESGLAVPWAAALPMGMDGAVLQAIRVLAANSAAARGRNRKFVMKNSCGLGIRRVWNGLHATTWIAMAFRPTRSVSFNVATRTKPVLI